MKTQILYEDRDILVCYKPAGIAVQSASSFQADMVSELKNYLAQKENKEPYLAVIHRLDQPVSGVLVFGKTKAAAASLSAQVQDGRSEKIYRAVVCGVFPESEKEGTLEHFLIKDGKTNTSKVIEIEKNKGNGKQSKDTFTKKIQRKDAKKATLFYRVLNENGGNSEVEIKLFTGRHHQIRVQMAHIGHPIVGDSKYGTLTEVKENFEKKKAQTENQEGLQGAVPKGLCLCAYRFSFLHPSTKKRLSFEVPRLPWAEK